MGRAQEKIESVERAVATLQMRRGEPDSDLQAAAIADSNLAIAEALTEVADAIREANS